LNERGVPGAQDEGLVADDLGESEEKGSVKERAGPKMSGNSRKSAEGGNLRTREAHNRQLLSQDAPDKKNQKGLIEDQLKNCRGVDYISMMSVYETGPVGGSGGAGGEESRRLEPF